MVNFGLKLGNGAGSGGLIHHFLFRGFALVAGGILEVIVPIFRVNGGAKVEIHIETALEQFFLA